MKHLSFVILITGTAHAQTFTLPAGRIVSGGGVSTGPGNPPFRIEGAIAQHDAHAASSGGRFRLAGGFYAAYATLQTAGAPRLTLTHNGAHTRLTWPASGINWALEWNPGLAPGEWRRFDPPPPVHGSTFFATTTSTRAFFRLRKR